MPVLVEKKPRLLHPILEDETVIQAFQDAIIFGESMAYNSRRPHHARTYRGVQGTYESYNKLAEYLTRAPFDFVHEDVNNQIRLCSPQGKYPHNIRLLLGRGKMCKGYFSVNPKGKLLQELLNKHNRLFSPTKSLFTEYQSSEAILFQNLCILTEIKHNSIITAYLVFPDELYGNRKNKLSFFDYELLFNIDITDHFEISERPESVDVDIQIGDTETGEKLIFQELDPSVNEDDDELAE